MIRRAILILLEAAAGLLAMLLLGGGIAAWRLTQGPLEVEALTPYLEQALDREAPVRMDIGRTILSWAGFGAPLEVRAVQLVAYGDSGAPVVMLPEVRLAFSLPALLRGRLAPVSFELVEPQLYAARTEDGTFTLDISTGASAADPEAGARMLGTLVDALRKPPNPLEPMGALTELRISRARLTMDNRQLGTVWTAPRLDLDLRRNTDGIAGEARLDLDLGGRVNHFTADLRYRLGDGAVTARMAFSDLQPAAFASLAPVLEPLGALQAAFHGHVTLQVDRNFAPREVRLDLHGDAGHLVMPDRFPSPVAFRGVHLIGRLEQDGQHLELDRFHLDLGRPQITVSGTMARRGDALDVAMKAELADVPMAELGRLWPVGLKENTRTWMLENLSDGIFDRTSFELAGTAPVSDPLALRTTRQEGHFVLSGFTVRYMPTLPPVRDIGGTAVFDGPTISLDLQGGTLLDMPLGTSKIVIDGLDGDRQNISIDIPLSGPVATALAVLDHEPLRYASKVNLIPAEVGGTAEIDLHFAFPLVRDLKMDMVEMSGRARLEDVVVDGIVAGIAATGGKLDLRVDRTRMDVTGVAKLNGVPSRIAWTENFPDAAEISTRVRVRAWPDDEGRARLKLDLPDWLNGTTGVDMVYERRTGGKERITAELDLTPSVLRVDLLDWRKEPGLPGMGRLTVDFVDRKPLRISSFSVRAGDLMARGRLDLRGEDYGIAHLELDRFRLGETDARLVLDARPDGGFTVDARGTALDARPFRSDPVSSSPAAGSTSAGDGAAAEEPEQPLDIRFDFDRVVTGAEGQIIRHAVGALSRTGRSWGRAVLDARVGDGANLAVRYGLEGDALVLSVTSDDGGAALRDLDILRHVRGGHLDVQGRSDPADPSRTVAGTIRLTDYQVQDAPVLARLLSAASPKGFANFLGGQPIAFSRLEGAFRWHERGVSFRDVRTSGSAMGLTAEGDIDLEVDTIDLQGTLVPFSVVNRLLGAIPLVGDLLVGGEGQGLFAATYRVTGPLAEPQIGVNPLAVLAPGFLRNLFFLGPPAGEGGTSSSAPAGTGPGQDGRGEAAPAGPHKPPGHNQP